LLKTDTRFLLTPDPIPQTPDPGPQTLDPSPTLRSIKAQYFLTFAVMGSVLPYLPVYLAERGLSDAQVGYVLSLGGLAVFLTPVLTTLLADLRFENRTLLAWVFAATAGSLAWLLASKGFWMLLAVHGLFSLAFIPALSLQDGLVFTERGRRLKAGLPATPYHRVRVYGTVGFIVPSLVLYGLMAMGASIGTSLLCGAAAGVLALMNTAVLPRTRGAVGAISPGAEVPDPHPPAGRDRSTPTAQALRRMLQPDLLLFCVASWLLQLSAGAFYAFYPIYLDQVIQLDKQWLGPISSIGVSLEIVYMLGFGWLLRRLGIKWMMAIGAATIALRMALLAFVPDLGVAVGTQVLHGMMVLAIHVTPPVYLNHRAGPAFRNSIQGLYAMAVFGTGRIVGCILAGQIAQGSASGTLAVFGWSAAAAGLSALLFAFAFKDRSHTPIES
jgi:MFS transporter, PPP family, 3-phenylpropionic acid transporter